MTDAGPRTPVVLLHGLGRTSMAMLPVAWALRRAGFHPLNVGYFGARRPVASTCALVAERLARLLRPFPPERPVHFVTHSLGGIVARAYLAANRRAAGGRLVQLAPPNQGARIAEVLRAYAPFRLWAGPCLDDLGVRDDGDRGPRHGLAPLDGVEVGVIAGGRTAAGEPAATKGFGPWFDDDSDGIVRVVETYLPEARDWILLSHVHTFIMNARDTHENVVAFLREGRFLASAPRLELGPDGRVRLSATARTAT